MQKPSRHFWGPRHSRTSSSLWLFTQPAGPGPRDIGATPWVLFSLMQMHSSQKAFIHSSQTPTFSSQFHCTATRFSTWVTGDSALGVSRLQNEGFGHDQLYAYSTCEMLLFFWDLKLIDIFLILSSKVHHEKPRIIECELTILLSDFFFFFWKEVCASYLHGCPEDFWLTQSRFNNLLKQLKLSSQHKRAPKSTRLKETINTCFAINSFTLFATFFTLSLLIVS